MTEEKSIKSWSEFEKLVSSHKPKRWIFRGQSNSIWKLSTSFMRSVNDVHKIYAEAEKEEISHRDAFELLLIQRFKSQAHLYLNYKPSSDLEWLTIMQHYGAPTRLIDWTFSPYIALFFALSKGTGNSAVFMMNQDKINKFYRIKTDSKDLTENLFNDLRRKDAFMLAFEPETKNERIVRQQGLFVIGSNNFEAIDEILTQDNLSEDNSFYSKFIIPSKLRFDFLKRLKSMNITNETLFPGIEGFCSSLKLSLLDSSENLKRII